MVDYNRRTGVLDGIRARVIAVKATPEYQHIDGLSVSDRTDAIVKYDRVNHVLRTVCTLLLQLVRA